MTHDGVDKNNVEVGGREYLDGDGMRRVYPKATVSVGDLVRYRHEAKGGYGFISIIPASLVKVGPKRVQIEIRTEGRSWRRWVDPSNVLPPREG